MFRFVFVLLIALSTSLFCHAQSSSSATPKYDAAEERTALRKLIDRDSAADKYHELGDAYRDMALTYSDEDRVESNERYDFFEKAMNAYQKAGSKKDQADMLKAMASLNMYRGKMQDAVTELKESIALYTTAKYDTIQEAYSLAGIAYAQIGNHNEALKYGLEAVKIAERLKDQGPGTGVIYNYLAVTYDKLGELNKTKEYLLKAMAITEKSNDHTAIMMLGINIASLHVKLGNPQDGLTYLQNLVKNYPVPDEIFMRLNVTSRFLYLYMHLKDYKNAEPYCKQLIDLCKQIPPDDAEQTVAYPSIINFFRETKQYDRAAVYISLLKDISEKRGFVDRLSQAYLQAYWIDSTRGNLTGALANYKLYKTYNDSFLAVSKTREVARLNVQFETEKKDRDIQVLKKEGELQQGMLTKSKALRNWMIAAIALLLIVVALLYSRYMLKKKSNRKINEQNQSLHQLLKEKEWLLKEVHHRVKNNLHTIYSLLDSQAAYLRTKEAVEAIRDSQHRVSAMSLIHQKLYRTEAFSVTNMHNYIHELADYFKDIVNAGSINFVIDVENVEFDLAYSVPIGLILNEAITNSIKYAFPGNEKPAITISMRRSSGDEYLLIVKDNGKGLPPGFDSQKNQSLGMSLMKGLSEDIQGQFKISSDNGTEIQIRFVYKQAVQAIF